MVDAARAAGVSLCVAYRRRLFPQVVAAKRLIEEGRIGEVVSVRTHYSGNMDIEDGAWRGDAAIGGSLMEMACHRQAPAPYALQRPFRRLRNQSVGPQDGGDAQLRG